MDITFLNWIICLPCSYMNADQATVSCCGSAGRNLEPQPCLRLVGGSTGSPAQHMTSACAEGTQTLKTCQSAMWPHLEPLGQISLASPSSLVHQGMSISAISRCMFVFSVCSNDFFLLFVWLVESGTWLVGWFESASNLQNQTNYYYSVNK